MALFALTTNLIVQIFVTLLLAWMFFSSARSSMGGAPFVPMGGRWVKPLLQFADANAEDILYDLGCGDGRVLFSAVKDFGIRRAIGYDISRFPLVIAAWRARRAGLRANITLKKGDARTADVADATLVYMYLYPNLTNELAASLAPQLKPGTRIICPMFVIDCGAHPEYRLKKEGKVGSITAHLYERV